MIDKKCILPRLLIPPEWGAVEEEEEGKGLKLKESSSASAKDGTFFPSRLCHHCSPCSTSSPPQPPCQSSSHNLLLFLSSPPLSDFVQPPFQRSETAISFYSIWQTNVQRWREEKVKCRTRKREPSKVCAFVGLQFSIWGRLVCYGLSGSKTVNFDSEVSLKPVGPHPSFSKAICIVLSIFFFLIFYNFWGLVHQYLHARGVPVYIVVRIKHTVVDLFCFIISPVHRYRLMQT